MYVFTEKERYGWFYMQKDSPERSFNSSMDQRIDKDFDLG